MLRVHVASAEAYVDCVDLVSFDRQRHSSVGTQERIGLASMKVPDARVSELP